MALQKRLHYGFSGYQVPPTPRGLRSARGNHSLKRKLEETQMGAFELLATVAGKLLQERETSPAFSNVSSARAEAVVVKNNVKQEEEDIEQPMNAEICDQGSIHENVVSKFGFQGHNQKSTSEEFQHAANGIKKNGNLVNGAVPNTCNSDDPLELDSDPPALVNSDSSEEVPFPGCQDDAKLVSSRDDDENSSGCTEPSITPLKASRPSKHIEDREIRKLLTSKYWEVAPKLEGEIYNNDEDKKPVPYFRNICYTRQRSMRDSFKRRKIDKSSVSTSDGGVSSEGTSSTPKKGTDTSTIGCSSEHAGSGVSSSLVAGQETSCRSKDSHVKLSIKSFKVPELYIEISETATVASLKRTVLEAVAAILGEGLHVGVLYQGKNIGDDSKTLLQSGICDDDKLDDLGFALEPNPLSAPASGCPKNSPYLEASHPLTRCPPSPTLGLGISDASPDSPIIGMANAVESEDSVPSPTKMLIEKKIPESRDLVAVPAISVEALAVVPLNRKSRRAELAQRRIRRPFSVTEVEALVHAVEKLGTGRWRDVKMRAFDNAKHRTYVDLKDKWKTLVHTAKISPQQRRGEPVPQELLNRVLAAHSHWSEQQAKQQVKQLTETCLLLQT